MSAELTAAECERRLLQEICGGGSSPLDANWAELKQLRGKASGAAPQPSAAPATNHSAVNPLTRARGASGGV